MSRLAKDRDMVDTTIAVLAVIGAFLLFSVWIGMLAGYYGGC